MKHFLARLVDRARGTAPRVEPIVASRFARTAPEIPAVTEFSEPRSEKAATASTVAPQESEEKQPSLRKAPDTPGQQPTPLSKPKPESQPVAPDDEPPPASAQTIDTPQEVIHESLLLPQHQEAPPLIVRQTQLSGSRAPVVTPTLDEKGVVNTPVERKHEAPPLIVRQTQLSRSKTPVMTSAPNEKGIANMPAEHKHEAQPKTEEPRQEDAKPAPLREPTLLVGPLSSSREEPPPQAIKPTWPETKQAHTPVARPRLSPLPERDREEAPIVHVTIGRIEVRAAPAPVTRARKPPRRPAPPLTLDAYLKSRKGVAR